VIEGCTLRLKDEYDNKSRGSGTVKEEKSIHVLAEYKVVKIGRLGAKN
jgi:hypothetical protein